MLEEIKTNLGANYLQSDENVLKSIIKDMTFIASNISNRKDVDLSLAPYIKLAVISEYLWRGSEGLLSKTEGSISSSYNDIIEKMRNDIIKNGLRRLI
ncbi:MAG: phage head-tail connector protein [Clostridia bacterium]